MSFLNFNYSFFKSISKGVIKQDNRCSTFILLLQAYLLPNHGIGTNTVLGKYLMSYKFLYYAIIVGN
jgi:hypothetical protein